MPQLAGRIAWVTGAGSGIGEASALALAEEGAVVVLTGRRTEMLAGVAAHIRDQGGSALVQPADLTDASQVQRVGAVIKEQLGRLDILVNNAGRGMKYVSERFLTEPTRFWEVRPDVFRMVIDTNVNGPFLMARAAVAPMLRGGWGRIVNVSMNRETMRRAGFSPYGPSKAALESETVIWAKDLAGTGVTVNAILPGGATATGMVPDSVSEEVRASLLQADVMVEPLVWLASTGADGVTGKRVIANRWRGEGMSGEAIEDAG